MSCFSQSNKGNQSDDELSFPVQEPESLRKQFLHSSFLRCED